MIKAPPTPLRLAALVAFVLSCVLVLAYLWISFGGSVPFGPAGYRVLVAFPQASELATGADVRIAGVDVGSVVALRLDRSDSRTLATLELDRRFAPIPRDTRATLRIKTLLGETYVELSAGQPAAGGLPDGGRLPDARVEPNVALDQILSTFDPVTRRAFRTWMQAQAAAVANRDQDINAAFGSLPGFVGDTDRALAALHGQSGALRSLVAGTGTFFDAISRQRGELSGLIAAGERLFATTAERNRQLAAVFAALPAFERESRLTLPALTAFARQADPVVRALEPIAPGLQRTFTATEALAPDLRALFARLGPTASAARRGLPALSRILGQIPPLLGAFEPFLLNANPMIRYIGAFKSELTGFFANVADAAQASYHNTPRGNKDLHYLRTTQTLSPLALALYPRALGSERDNAYRAPGAYDGLARGLAVLSTAGCSAGDPAPPVSTSPPSLAAMVAQYAFRSASRTISAPPCRGQGPIPGFTTLFPQLRADPPPALR